MRWFMAGHEIVASRGTFRHASFKHDLPPDTPIKLDGEPIVEFGQEVLAKHLLPERLDLATDEAGNVVDQDTFVKRMRAVQREYTYPSGTDIESEYVPNVLHYVLQVPDPMSECGNLKKVHYDPQYKPPGEWKAKQRFTPDGMPEEEFMASQAKDGERIDKLIEALSHMAGVPQDKLVTPDEIEAAAPAPEPMPTDPEAEVETLCGKQRPVKNLRHHESTCAKCKGRIKDGATPRAPDKDE